MNREKPKPAPEDLRDKKGGTYDVDPALAKDAYDADATEGVLPEGLIRERKGPVNPKTGRHPSDEK